MVDFYANYYAKKERVVTHLHELGALSRQSAVTASDLAARFGAGADSEAYDIAVRGAEVKYHRETDSYWLGGTRNNGRS